MSDHREEKAITAVNGPQLQFKFYMFSSSDPWMPIFISDHKKEKLSLPSMDLNCISNSTRSVQVTRGSPSSDQTRLVTSTTYGSQQLLIKW